MEGIIHDVQGSTTVAAPYSCPHEETVQVDINDVSLIDVFSQPDQATVVKCLW